MNISATLGHGLSLVPRLFRRLLMGLCKHRFHACGRNAWFDPNGHYSYATISIGDDVFLGLRPILSAGRSHIRIGNKVMFGPEVCVLGGNHRFDLEGRFMSDIREDEKRAGDDPGVEIEDDVWVGARAVILPGVRIGRGAVIGAGSVVTRAVPPYSIVVGVPGRVIRWRWPVDRILAHEECLYKPEHRIAMARLIQDRALHGG